MTNISFTDLLKSVQLLKGIEDYGLKEPTDIQKKCIPDILNGLDIVGQSQTGSGKTAAFVLPLLEKINLNLQNVQGLILCPTRELSIQVVNDIKKFSRSLLGLQVLPIIGGVPGREQAEALNKGVHIVVATPGRLVDHIIRGQIRLESINYVVLDEADKMLDLGFEKEVVFILKSLPKKRQTIFFSATIPESIQSMSQKFQHNPIHIRSENSLELKPKIEEFIYESEKVKDSNEILKVKIHTLLRILQQHPSPSTVIFCNQKLTVTEIEKVLIENEVSCSTLTGELEQVERDKVIALFRNASLRILIATDVAARGLDIEHIELVVNFDLPLQPEIYVHRIGRTGRAGRTGVAVSIMNPGEELKVNAIEKYTGNIFNRGKLGFKNQYGLNSTFQSAKMKTLHISGGKKDKLRPGDILGALTAQPNSIESKDIGKIDIQDRYSFVAVATELSDIAFEKLKSGKIKGHKFQIKFVK